MPQAAEALISVKAISLNRGEVVYRLQGEAGTRLGWDLAGVVDRPAADGSGPARGTRVVGLVHSGAWAEQVAVPTNALAELEASVSFAQAAALPMAGLTALSAIEHGGGLLADPRSDARSLVTYEVTATRPGDVRPYHAHLTSVYVAADGGHDGEWRLAFHQQTPVP
jgi:NADPH:quinone reductase-like Zn-dependent oxidoreductase